MIKAHITLIAFFFFCLSNAQSQLPFDFSLDVYASGFSSPVDIDNAGDDRLFIIERSGRIKIIDSQGTVIQTPFLDIDERVHNSGNQSEQGLLGIAFHPDYKNNGYFFLHYTANNDDGVISRFSVDPADPNRADPNSEKEIMVIDQPYNNHNGGCIKFGPDGYLYIGLGDGGSANDPQNFAQNPQTVLGKMLRIDIDNGDPYSIPSNNPFVSDPEILDEIWATGLRNPWKFSFDRKKGDLWIADVGQGDWEEINKEDAGFAGGNNYGWRCYEGSSSFAIGGCGPSSEYTSPYIEYNHIGLTHCSITGGYVYRGNNSALVDYDLYFYADYCSGALWCSVNDGQSLKQIEIDRFFGFAPSTFGEDLDGEIYMASISNGRIYHLNLCKSIEFQITEDDNLSAPDGFDSYQWLLNDEEIVGATSRTFLPLVSGIYTVLITDENGCSFLSDELDYKVLSIGSISGLEKFELNPNPVNETLNLNFVSSRKINGVISITNNLGQTLYKKEISINGESNLKINTSEFEAAFYNLIITSKKQIQISRFLKL